MMFNSKMANVTGHPDISSVFKDTDSELTEWRNCMDDQAFLYFSYGLFAVIFFPTVFGNVLILVSIVKFRHLRTNMHILIGNLAVSDLLIGVCIILQVLGNFGWEFVRTKYYCLSVMAVLVISMGTSSCNLLTMSVERFTAIQYPLRHKIIFTKRKTYISIVCCWVYHVIFASLPVMGWNNYTDDVTVCDTDLVWVKMYDVLLFGGTLTVVVVNCVLCGVVARTIVRKRNMLRYSSSTSINSINVSGNFRRTKLTMIVFVVFALCWLPYLILSLILTLRDIGSVRCARQWCISTGILNSAMNWIIYGLANRSFREAFKVILRRKSREQLRNSLSSTM